MKYKTLIIPLLILISASGYAQKSASENGENYLVVDLSKTLPGNEIHDRLYYLTKGSEDVQLPAELTTFLENVQDEPGLHSKLTWLRTSVLKIIYNPRVRSEDKKFVCNHYINEDNIQTSPIVPFLKDYLKGNLKF